MWSSLMSDLTESQLTFSIYPSTRFQGPRPPFILAPYGFCRPLLSHLGTQLLTPILKMVKDTIFSLMKVGELKGWNLKISEWKVIREEEKGDRTPLISG